MVLFVPLFAGVGIIAWHHLRTEHHARRQPLEDALRSLEGRGFKANPGFAGTFGPGTLVQTAELDSSGHERQLSEPIVFKWAADCFPGREPQEHQYLVAESSGQDSDQLEVDGSIVNRDVPALALHDDSVASYSLRFGRVALRTFAKGDLSGGFAKVCVDALDRAKSAGDPPALYQLVLETVVASSLEYNVRWRNAADRSAHVALAQLLEHKLGKALKGEDGPAVSVHAESQDQAQSTLKASGEALLAYRLRPIELAGVSEIVESKRP